MNRAIVRSFRGHQALPSSSGVYISRSSWKQAVRVEISAPYWSSSSPSSSSSSSLRKVRTLCSDPADSKQQHNMEKADDQQPKDDKKGDDVMSHSFGEGYATRSDEEGFGGVYGGNDGDDDNMKLDKKIHESHPAYDKSQGSEVKEKEKGRNQTGANG